MHSQILCKVHPSQTCPNGFQRNPTSNAGPGAADPDEFKAHGQHVMDQASHLGLNSATTTIKPAQPNDNAVGQQAATAKDHLSRYQPDVVTKVQDIAYHHERHASVIEDEVEKIQKIRGFRKRTQTIANQVQEVLDLGYDIETEMGQLDHDILTTTDLDGFADIANRGKQVKRRLIEYEKQVKAVADALERLWMDIEADQGGSEWMKT